MAGRYAIGRGDMLSAGGRPRFGEKGRAEILVRVANAFFAALFLAAAAAAIARASGTLWPAALWAGLFVLFAGLCFANLRARGAVPPPLALANAAALLLAGAGLILAGDGAARWIAGLSAVPFAATLLALAARTGRGV